MEKCTIFTPSGMNFWTNYDYYHSYVLWDFFFTTNFLRITAIMNSENFQVGYVESRGHFNCT